MLAWKRYTASDVNLIAGGEMKVTAAREGKQFFDDGYWSRELLAWSLPKLEAAESCRRNDLHLQSTCSFLSPSTRHTKSCIVDSKPHSFISTFLFYFFEA